MNEWISVEDRLPLDDSPSIKYIDMEVIVYGEVNGSPRIEIRFYEKGTCNKTGNHWHGWDASDYAMDPSEITHWMPLPEPPK